MIEAAICICGFLVLGGITKYISGDGSRYSEEYYNYLRNNKKSPDINPHDYNKYNL